MMTLSATRGWYGAGIVVGPAPVPSCLRDSLTPRTDATGVCSSDGWTSVIHLEQRQITGDCC
jgi:hypothetical protein